MAKSLLKASVDVKSGSKEEDLIFRMNLKKGGSSLSCGTGHKRHIVYCGQPTAKTEPHLETQKYGN